MPEQETELNNQPTTSVDQSQTDEVESSNESVEESVDVKPQDNSVPSGNNTKKEEKTKPVQTQEQNAYYAKLRRLEAKIEALEKEKRESVSETALTAFGFTREDLKDSDNIALTQAYSKGVSEGVENPKEYAYKTLYESRKAETRRNQETQANIQKDIEQFNRLNPNVQINVVTSDPDFQQYYHDVYEPLGIDINGNVAKIYETYKRTQKKTAPVNATANQKQLSQPPTVNGQSNVKQHKLTDEEILKLPKAEFDKYINDLLKK